MDHHRAVAAIANQVETTARAAARRALTAWADTDSTLAGWANAAEVAAAIRTGPPAVQDSLITALLRAGGELAELTVVAGLSRRLGRVVDGWATAGVDRGELAELEAELVAECWAATHTAAATGRIPVRPGLRLVDAAHEAVRVPRRRLRRAAGRQVPLDAADHQPAAGTVRTAADQLAVHLADVVRTGQVSVPGAQVVFLTRVAGFTTTETAARLGCTPGVLRVTRGRAERRLVRAA